MLWTLHLKGGPEIHRAVPVGNKLYSFGVPYMYNVDFRNRSGQIEVHILNTVSLRWMNLPPATTKKGERPLEVPPDRTGYTAVLIDDIIYIWGGYTSNSKYWTVLYAFDVNTHRWFKPVVYGTVPQVRKYHSACVLAKAMYIYGGFNKLRYLNSIHKLDAATMIWSSIDTRGTVPPASTCHSATIIGKRMFVFGGRGDKDEDEYKKIRVFDTDTNCWLRTPSAHIHPEGCKSHSAFADNRELYIFGGYDSNSLWKFNPEVLSWKKIVTKGLAPCQMHSMCCCMVGDRVIFGGYSELYIFDLNPSLKTLCKLAFIQYGFERSGLSHDARWELAAMASNKQHKNNISQKGL